MEKYLPDALCKRIENRVMVPHLKRGDWDNAILNTVDAISEVLSGESELQFEEEEKEEATAILTRIMRKMNNENAFGELSRTRRTAEGFFL